MEYISKTTDPTMLNVREMTILSLKNVLKYNDPSSVPTPID